MHESNSYSSIKYLTIATIFAIIFISCIYNLFVCYLNYSNTSLDTHKTIIIPPNESISKISKNLASNNIILYPKIFRIISCAFNINLKSGEYQFSPDIRPIQVLRKLNIGKSIVHRLYVPENIYAQLIIDKINQEDRLLGNDIYHIPEGHLMPDTYFYSYGDIKKDIIQKMLSRMSLALDDAMKKLDPNSPLKSRKDILTLASIIGKETSVNKEKPIIAAIFLNRFKKGMRLQACPTVYYAITLGKYTLTRRLTNSDLKTNSEYNTYKIYGLPPTPISCPDITSINAVVSPANVDYLYFVSNGRGSHLFAKTLKEHNRNIKLFHSRRK